MKNSEKKKSKKFEKMSVDSFFETLSSEETKIDLLRKEKDDTSKLSKKTSIQKKTINLKKSFNNIEARKIKKDDKYKELFGYLEKNDTKLYNFVINEQNEQNLSDNDDNDVYTNDDLEVASDESDFEIENEAELSQSATVTLKLLQEWERELQSSNVALEVIRNVIKAFHSALISISTEKSDTNGEFRIEGPAIFNGIVQLCILNIEGAVKKYLKISTKSNFRDIQNCKRFSKLKNILRIYLEDLTKLLESVASNNILSVVLKHLHQISSMLIGFKSIQKPILKRLIALWSTGEESIRILAFLCILKITRNNSELLSSILRSMYMDYVKNTKFVSVNSLPSINFMRRSLTELFLLDLKVSYNHIFLFIRQLAIHLRNAMTLQKTEHFNQVYNWQYINSLKLWGEVLSNIGSNTNLSQSVKSNNQSKLQALIYPLISIINGVIKLKSTAQYFPLRFHCIKILVDISRETKIYVPILPYIIEVLNSNVFNLHHKKLAMKPMTFMCILRIQKGHMDENSFRDEIIEQIYSLSLESLLNECTSIALPDLIVPFIITINNFIKKTKNPNYKKKMKQLVDKITEQSNYINSRRTNIQFSLTDLNYIKSWEVNNRTGETPFELFYDDWQKSNKQKIKSQKRDSENEDIDENHSILKTAKSPHKKLRSLESTELFPSDDEDNTVFNFETPTKNASKDFNKIKKSSQTMLIDQSDSDESLSENEFPVEKHDIIEDINIENW